MLVIEPRQSTYFSHAPTSCRIQNVQLVQDKFANPNCAHKHLPHNSKSLYNHPILYQNKDSCAH